MALHGDNSDGTRCSGAMPKRGITKDDNAVQRSGMRGATLAKQRRMTDRGRLTGHERACKGCRTSRFEITSALFVHLWRE